MSSLLHNFANAVLAGRLSDHSKVPKRSFDGGALWIGARIGTLIH